MRRGLLGPERAREDGRGEPVFRWDALAGAFAPYVGGTTPRRFSPCGLCLDRDATILVSRPARVFRYFEAAEPEIVEGLIVPVRGIDARRRSAPCGWSTTTGAAGSTPRTRA